jgi:GAF domain-containing protein
MRAMLDQEIIHVRDMEAEPGILESIRALGHRSQLSVPMPRDGKALGVIILAANQPGGFSDSQVELLKTFAEQAAIAISGTETYRALQTRHHRRAEGDVRIT